MLNILQLDRPATILKPDAGKTLKFLGNVATCKFNPDNRGWQFYELVTTAGNPVPLHSHPWDEVSYLLEGEVDLQIADQQMLATPGYFINLPAGVAHAFSVRSLHAKFLVGTSNPIAIQFMTAMAQAEQVQQLTSEQIMAIAQKHQVQVVADLGKGPLRSISHHLHTRRHKCSSALPADATVTRCNANITTRYGIAAVQLSIGSIDIQFH